MCIRDRNGDGIDVDSCERVEIHHCSFNVGDDGICIKSGKNKEARKILGPSSDADPETGCMEFDIAKGRFSFRLTAPYSEERRAVCQREQRRRQAEIELKCS